MKNKRRDVLRPIAHVYVLWNGVRPFVQINCRLRHLPMRQGRFAVQVHSRSESGELFVMFIYWWSSCISVQVGASLWQQLRFGNSTLFNAERRRFRGGGLHFPHSTCNSEWGTCKPQGLNRSRSGFVKIRLPWVANGKLLPKGSSDLYLPSHPAGLWAQKNLPTYPKVTAFTN